jgi:hypothetical protein
MTSHINDFFTTIEIIILRTGAVALSRNLHPETDSQTLAGALNEHNA